MANRVRQILVIVQLFKTVIRMNFVQHEMNLNSKLAYPYD